MSGEPWTAEQDEALRRMTAARRSRERMGRALNRSSTAIRNRQGVLGLIAARFGSPDPLPSPPPPFVFDDAERAAQDAKPASEKWPYPRSGLVERVWFSRPATEVLTGSTLS